MSGQYQFNRDSARSPLDRQTPNLFPAGQPSTFKTNVNRAKTKKWVEAKPYSYDGDDWGEYDEYDEYGTEQAPPPQQSTGPTGLRQKGQTLAEPTRSFTDPQRQAPPQPGRRNSFEAGDEHRAFSSTTPQPGGMDAYANAPPHMPSPAPGGQPGYAAPQQPQQPHGQPAHAGPIQPSGLPNTGFRQASAAESEASDTPQHRRDFSPSAMPPPLQTRISPAPSSATASPANSKFPTRKSSIGQADPKSMSNSPVNPMSSRDRAPSNPAKALPFIRPSDIYKRVEEERQKERASLDSSRPSMDSLSSRPKDEAMSPREREGAEQPRSPDTSRSLQPLETVAERKSEYLPDLNVGAQQSTTNRALDPAASSDSQPALPEVRRISAFGDDLWPDAPQDSQNSHNANSTITPPDQQGFRSAVDQAFTRTDDQRSIPPTPISKSDSSVSRSNTDSTSGISPIMSRVPSSATSVLKARGLAGGDSSTPAIAEETSESSTPVSRPVSTAMLGGPYQIPRKPSPSHSRNVSTSSLPRASASPSPGESPARSPAFESHKPLPEGESAQLSSLSMQGGLDGPSSAYASREADFASAMRTNPVEAAPALKAAQKESQDAFLESHSNMQSPMSDAQPRSRSESPGKGRVQELAGKFGDVSHTRRGSTQSNASRNSIQSWEKSQDNSRAPSPTKADVARTGNPGKESSAERPLAAREASFRPKLPGQWESYATSVPTPSDQSDRESQVAVEESGRQGPRTSPPLDEVDLTPTTAKHPVSSPELSKSPSDPLAALKAAGAAMGEAFASVGLGSSSEEPEDRTPTKTREYGDVYLARPAQLDRAVSTASTIPPTPPAKDSPESEELPPPPPLKEKSPGPISPPSQQSTPVRPTILPQLSSDPSEQDQESDRLRKEIVASLSPLRSSGIPESEPTGSALQPGGPIAANRESSILPSEYDSYWADDQTSPRPSNDLGRQSQPNVEQAPDATESSAPQPSEVARTALLTRFSWEEPGSKDVPADDQAISGAGANFPPVATEEPTSAPAMGQGPSGDSLNQSFAGIPDPYFGPAHTMSISKPDRVTESDLTVISPTPPPESEKPIANTTNAEAVRDVPHASGLHVVNSASDPEAVDIPPRLSAENRPCEEEVKSPQASDAPQPTILAVGIESIPDPSVIHEPAMKSPITDKPLSTKEIGALKSPSERIATYNQTRNYWANNDHGLNEWIASAVAANPELVTQPIAEQRPLMTSSGTSRHKHTASLSLFGKHHGSSNAQPPTTPYYEQYNSAAAHVPTTPTSAGNPQAHPFGPGSGIGGRSASHQMQNKGKDILHSAGILGGKGVTGAKGLFAKGKSRFRASGSGDKAARSQSVSSSREASEEPELITMPERNHRMSTDLDGHKEEKKKRRLSSPFHRSSRSRSRPSSIVLPKNAHLDFGTGSTPRNTPPRETPPPAEGSRPHSYHAPDSWNVMSDSPQPMDQSTPPRGGLQPPERLGVLPSPAKSAFSLLPHEKDENIPPVPRIPEGMEDRHNGRESIGHRVLQSVIRHSTPPAMDTSKLRDSPIFAAEKPDGVLTSPDQAVDAQDENKAPHQTQIGDDDDRPPQLNHEPVLPTDFSQHSSKGSDISPPTVPKVSDAGDISPVVSSAGPEDPDEDDDKPPRLELDFLRLNTQHGKGDVSPMFRATMPAVDGAGSDPPTVVDLGGGVPRETVPAYETEKIGGDVSPISLHAGDDEEPTPTKDMREHLLDTPTAGHAVNEHEAAQQGTETPAKADSNAGGSLRTPQHNAAQNTLAAPPPSVATQQPQSVSPYHVVRAVQYVPSHSSLESWEQDSAAAPSQSDGSQLGDRLDDHDIPPVPHVPHHLQARDKAEEVAHAPEFAKSDLDSSTATTTINNQSALPGSIAKDMQQHSMAAPANSAGHKRTQSLLSAISSAVSADGASKSPASRPSSANRQTNGAKASPGPQHVPLESTSSMQKSIAAPDQDEYDLYADHNGIVKDVRDEQGQPLRVATTQAPVSTSVSQPPATNGTQNQQAVNAREEDGARYSFDRPMSFVSVPRDSNGRPQEQINRPVSAGSNIPPVPQIPAQLQGQQTQIVGRTQAEPQILQAAAQPEQPGKPGSNTAAYPDRGNVSPVQNGQPPQPSITHSISNVSSQPPSQASPPPQEAPRPNQAQQPPVQNGTMPNGQIRDPRMQDPRLAQDPRPMDRRMVSDPRMVDPRMMQDPRMMDPRMMQDPRIMRDPRMMQDPRLAQDPRLMQDPRLQDPRFVEELRRRGIFPGGLYPQDPRAPIQMQVPGQAYPPDPRMQLAGSPQPPRNQYELQQQMMQRQAMDPRLRDAEYRLPGVGPPQSGAQPIKQEEKSSSRPKLGSMFKSLGGKSSTTPPPAPNQPNHRINPTLSAPEDAGRAFSYQSSVGDLPVDQMAAKKKEKKSSVFGSLGNRPHSVGTESHFSQDSTLAQAASSRLDLRYPQSPAPANGIPPQQPPPGASMPPKQPQQQRISASGTPEPGKKKRFSALGSLFHRSGTGTATPPKGKLSKEEKKSQKAQKHNTPPPMQLPPAQHWPQQQLQFRPQPQGLQYVPPGAPRPYPGMQLVPQTMPPQARQQQPGTVQQQMPQHIYQQQPQQQLGPQAQQAQNPSLNGSAYLNTRQIAIEQQAQQQVQQAPPQQASQQIAPQQVHQQVPQQVLQQAPQQQMAQQAQAPQQQAPQQVAQQIPEQATQQTALNSRPEAPGPVPSFEHTIKRPEGEDPPLDGYYSPEKKRWSHGHGAAGFAAIEQQQHTVASHHPSKQRRVSSPASAHGSSAVSPVSERRVSSPLTEPRYDTPQIPAAYNHVSGTYVPPSAQPATQVISSSRLPPVADDMRSRQYSEPRMQTISPQVSMQSQTPSNERTQSNSSIPSVVSPISNPSPGIPSAQPVSNQRIPKQRMSSISEATSPERPWNVDVPAGATEQEIVRARHQQHMAQIYQQQMAAQQQLQVEKNGQSPSPHLSSQQTQSPSPNSPQHPVQHQEPPSVIQGFREVLPRGSPQPYPLSQPMLNQAPTHQSRDEQQQPPSHSRTPQPLQPAPIHPGDLQTNVVQPAAYPLPMSPDSTNTRSPINPLAAALPPPPPPKVPHSPMVHAFAGQQASTQEQQYSETQQQPYQPTSHTQPTDYDQHHPDEPPPSYSGPGVENDGMDKERQERHRPPNIMTNAEDRGREREGRSRQPSIGILQHPQPASMAASPQRSSADMGADILRRQLLEQEERDRVDRLRRVELQRVMTEQERRERERARERARELERSVSGGGRVGSLRSVRGSSRGSGWERRGSTTRPVFELPAEEDDEPVMRATSFPGQEWVPTWTED